jgi:GNAT superfamily N-acetyltransferase
MRPEDIPSGLDLCRAAGWNQTRRDWLRFLTTTPDGARTARIDGRIVGTAATIRHGDAFAWIGMVLVDPSARRRGIGTRLFDEALDLVSDMRTVRLDATPAGRPMYLKRGFEEEYRIHRMELAGASWSARPDARVRPMTEGDLPEVAAFDEPAFGTDRLGMLTWMREGAPELAWVALSAGTIDGFVLGRRGHVFDHVGPVVARDVSTARALVPAALAAVTRTAVVDATPHVPAWRNWLAAIGFSEQRELIRMSRGTPPVADVDRQFAILGPEFG